MCYYERTGGAAETAIKTSNTAVYHVFTPSLFYFILFYFILLETAIKTLNTAVYHVLHLLYFSLFTVCVIS